MKSASYLLPRQMNEFLVHLLQVAQCYRVPRVAPVQVKLVIMATGMQGYHHSVLVNQKDSAYNTERDGYRKLGNVRVPIK